MEPKTITINVTERIVTNDEDLYLSIKEREDESIIDDLLQERYGWAFEDPEDIIGYIWAQTGSGYGRYIIHYNIYNFPVAEISVPDFNIEEFLEDLNDDNYEWYTDNTFDGVIEKIEIND